MTDEKIKTLIQQKEALCREYFQTENEKLMPEIAAVELMLFLANKMESDEQIATDEELKTMFD